MKLRTEKGHIIHSRLWEGTTERGSSCIVAIATVGLDITAPSEEQTEWEKNLQPGPTPLEIVEGS